MRFLAPILLSALLLAQPAKEALRQQIAETKIKAFELQMQIELLEKQLKDLEDAEALKPLPTTEKQAPSRIRCTKYTTDSKRCTRMAEAGSRVCWQHKTKR